MSALQRCVVAIVGGAALVLAGPVRADDAAQRAALSTQRREAEARYAERARACNDRFAVTGCLEAARAERREALQPIAQREAALDDLERGRRARQRQQQIDAKRMNRDARASEPLLPLDRATTTTRAPRGAEPAAPRPAEPRPTEPRRRQADAQQARESYERRQQQIEQKRQRAADAAAQRLRSGKAPAAPLPPLPAAEPASRR